VVSGPEPVGGTGEAVTTGPATGIVPSPLRAGDLVAVVAPSGPLVGPGLDEGVALLESWGLRVRVDPSIHDVHHHLAGTDARRAEELSGALVDDEVRAVWCARGGYGLTRIAAEAAAACEVAAEPKWVVGYSDATALHRVVRSTRGWVTAHSIGVCELGRVGPGTDAARSVRDLVFGRVDEVVLAGTVIRDGSATGVVDGGNLAVLAALCGTPWALGSAGILVTEDVNERPYALDRLLTQVLTTSVVGAVAYGQFTRCEDDRLDRPVATAAQVVAERSGLVDGPVLADLAVGHIGGRNLAVPLGAEGRLDGSTLRIALT